jgi:hypothetical protein
MEFPQSLKKLKSFVLPTLLGAIGGYAYYYFIGCNGGTCLISSNPYISTTYGAVVGALVAPGLRRSKDVPVSHEQGSGGEEGQR